MNCPNCNHPSEGGKFCENCGASLTANDQTAATTVASTNQAQPNKQLEAAKNISKMYFAYFMTVLKKPFSASQEVGREQFVNGIITIILYALFIPLMSYISLGSGREYIDAAFLNIVVKPTIAYAIFLLLIAVFVFIAVKLGKINVSIQDVIARFGTAMIPFVALFAAAIVLAIIQATVISMLLITLGFFLSIFTVPALVITSYKKDTTNGLDAAYGTFLTYILTIITILIMAEVIFSTIIDMLESSFGFF